MSSICLPRCGNKSLTSIPLLPRGENFQSGFLRNSFSYPGRLRVSGWSNVTCFPWSATSRGFGSNEST